MGKFLSKRDRQVLLKPDEVIRVYECGSRGKVLANFNAISEYSKLESLTGRAGKTSSFGVLLGDLLSGKHKKTFSHHFNCYITARIKKL
jgi:hypothetical protein